jgi:hypothetical protein
MKINAIAEGWIVVLSAVGKTRKFDAATSSQTKHHTCRRRRRIKLSLFREGGQWNWAVSTVGEGGDEIL